MSTETQNQPDKPVKKVGTVFINDDVFLDVKTWVEKRGTSMSWLFATSAKLLLKSMHEDPKFLDTLDVEDYKDAAG